MLVCGLMACLHPSSPSSSESEEENEEECMVEVGNYSVSQSTLLKVFSKLRTEELVTKSSKGAMISSLTDAFLSHINSAEVVSFCDNIVIQLQSCLQVNRKGKVSLTKLWRNFHLLRLSATTQNQWQSCVRIFGMSKDILTISETTLQLVLKRTMESVVQQITESKLPHSRPQVPTDLSIRELNVIRYIAGYVVLKMKKSIHFTPGFLMMLWFVHDYNAVGSVDDYSRTWVEQVDRGGLYHVNDCFFNLLKQIECVCRQYLDTRIDPTESL